MQAAQNLFAGEQGVAYIPMPKGRGFTPRLVMSMDKIHCTMYNKTIARGNSPGEGGTEEHHIRAGRDVTSRYQDSAHKAHRRRGDPQK